MKLHRFYVGDIELTHDFWLSDNRLTHQWMRVLRFLPGSEVALFDNHHVEKIYKIIEFGSDNAAHLQEITEVAARLPERNIYLCFALLKKDKNDWVLQKATELGVRHFIPLITERTEKTGFDRDRAEKIVIEAAEQSGRADVPRVREPLRLPSAITELQPIASLFVAEQQLQSPILKTQSGPAAVFIGPEGGWSPTEKQLFSDSHVENLNLGQFTLRAETACVVAAARFML